MQRLVYLILCVVLVSPMVGCETPDQRLTEFVTTSTSQQAMQNREMAEVTRTAAEHHRLVVEAVEKSRQEVVNLQQDVQEELRQLDAERRTMAESRRRESLLVPVINHLGLLLVAVLPLALCWYLLHGLSNRGQEDAVCDLLIQELIAEPLESLTGPEPKAAIEHAAKLEPPQPEHPAE
jgi:hypothetical protein